MIIRSIRVSGWRCLGDPVEVKELAEGINIIHAPNGAGKSSLFEALARAMFDMHGTTAKEMQEIRSWGKALAPTVVVEFSHGGVEYRLRKQFLDDASAKLDKKESGRFTAFAEGREADNRVREMLSKNPPGKGLSRLENWGLAQVLWVKQGELACQALSGDLLDKVKASLGVQLVSAGAGRLEELIESSFGAYFTETGKPRSGKDASPVTRLEQAVREATSRQADALAKVQELEQASRRVEDLRAKKDQAQRTLELLQKAVKEARAKREQYDSLVSERRLCESQRNEAEARYQGQKSRVDSIQEARERLSALAPMIQELRERLPLSEREVAMRTAAEKDAAIAFERARAEWAKADGDRERAARARKFIDLFQRLAGLQERRNRIRECEKTIEAHQQARSAFLAPDKAQLKKIQDAVRAFESAKEKLDSALITLEITPQQSATAAIVLGDDAGQTRNLQAGAVTRFQGSPQVQIELLGFGTIRAHGPAGDVEDLRRAAQKAERTLGELTEGYPEKDLDSLAALHEKRAAIEALLRDAQVQLRAHLGQDTLEAIDQEISHLIAVIADLAQDHPEWKEQPPDADALEAEALERYRVAQRALAEAEKTQKAAQETLRAAQERFLEESARLKHIEKDASETELRLKKLLDDELTDGARKDRLQKSLLEWNAANLRLKEIEERLAALGGDPQVELEKLEQQRAGLEREAREIHEREVEQGAIMARMAEDGPYSRLAAAEEELARNKAGLEAEKNRAAALMLLRETVRKCKEEALMVIAGPVQAAATRILHRISGERLGTLVLGESLNPTGIKPAAAGAAVSIECASGGEQEQIFLATRLALAEVLAKEERQMVVLDDVLLATDAGRLARIARVLEEAAEKLQILILTCHQDRYLGLSNAKMIDLEKLCMEGRG
jgi:DNA repair exonuclease SbcCD ATPase subunit